MRRIALTLAAVVPLAAAPFLLARDARAATVTFTITPTGEGQQFLDRTGLDVESLKKQLQSEVERAFQLYRLADYLRAFNDAHAFTTRGLGVDYASNLRYFMFGAAANVSINADERYVPKDTSTRPPLEGLATNATFMAGVNLGLIGLRPVTIYGNYFRSEGTFREFDSELDNKGVHVQLKLLAPKDQGSLVDTVIRWGGIDITTGFDHAHQHLKLGRRLRTQVPLMVQGQSAQVQMDSMGTFDLDMRSWSIPLELTTNVRLLYLLSLYGGVGFDWQVGGGSELAIGLDGALSGEIRPQTARYALGTARIDATETAEPSAGQVRGIFGVQANLWLVRVFAQLNFVPDPFAASVAFGARIAY